MFLKLFKSFLIVFAVFLFLAPLSYAQFQESRYEAKIIKVLEEKQINALGEKQLYQKLELSITNGNLKGKKIISEHGKIPLTFIPKYNLGDEVYIVKSESPEKAESFIITDYVRRTPIYILFFFFAILTIFIGRVRGALSLLGMAISFFAIFVYILPNIVAGRDPIFIAISASIFLIPITFYLSHGINGKTTSAVISTIISMIIIGILSSVFTEMVHLSGFSSDEASYVQTLTKGIVNMRGLLLAGILIGALGVLDDITISQSAIVYKLKETNPNLHFGEVWKKTMDIGKDHIASMVNTLVLVYTGASLPLLLLFINSTVPFGEALNYEMLAEEIVRTLVASIGLILAVPITTFISSYLVEFRKSKLIFIK
ncbi:MAG: YibE/F family protein [Patescibacteria group bacterium]